MHANRKKLRALETLRVRSDFLSVQGSGKKWVSHGLILQVKENGLNGVRVGYTVSKKTDKSAVRRNRIKRRLRAVAADVLSAEAALGHDYVLVGRPLTATRPYETLLQDLRWCLKKMGLQANRPEFSGDEKGEENQ